METRYVVLSDLFGNLRTSLRFLSSGQTSSSLNRSGQKLKQGIEYFDTRGEATVAVGVTEGQSSVRAEAAGKNDSSVEATPAGVDGSLNARSGTSTVEQGSVAQVPHAAGNATSPCGPADSIQSDQPCPAVSPRAVAATITVMLEQGDVPEGCHEAVAPEPGLVAEAVDPTTFQQDAGLKKPTGDLHVENTEPVLHKQAAVSSEPVLTKENVDFPEPLLPKQVAGNTKPTTSMQYVDENAPVRVQQAAVMESPAIGVSPTRTKRSLQGKYESKLFDGGCRGRRATPSSIMKILS
ncbi:hypothetical protein V6N11_025433 [Hibiscus sabdariffa]|uniref:Uncharacterized protein n=2 Tax=Hibiscus sabdariffa TaxID=183260 RepID=A0ABR2NA01_9ROSI